jgi:hypothetical protein
MGFFDSVVNFLTGGLGTKIVDKVMNQFPDKLSEKEKADIKAAIVEASREHELKLLEIAKQEEESFNKRIKELEGTAGDLEKFGFFGRLVVFLRGMQRPLWGYTVLIMDILVFSGRWDLAALAQQVGG